MEITKNIELETQGVEFWEKELEYLEEAMQGMRTSYAIVQSNHRYCQEKLAELLEKEKEK